MGILIGGLKNMKQSAEQFFPAYGSLTYKMSSDFMTVLQELIPGAIPSQNCYVNVSLILSSYGDLDI
jgi:hypothetical protein